MPRHLDPRIAEILRNYGEDPTDSKGVIWDCHGTWVVYHKALERVAARAGISFDKPDVLRSERDEAVIMVTGRMADRTDWDIGEALIGVNYRVSGKQAAYVYAMALKRGRDRLILKLVGLHGLLYSEEEADEFKPAPQPAPEEPKRDVKPADGRQSGRPAAGTPEWREALFKHARARAAIGNDALNEWWGKQSGEAQAALEEINSELDEIVNRAAGRRESAE